MWMMLGRMGGGMLGRGKPGGGWRYGKPHMDRSRGAVKIPTRVAL
jgi:hypothetical protein